MSKRDFLGSLQSNGEKSVPLESAGMHTHSRAAEHSVPTCAQSRQGPCIQISPHFLWTCTYAQSCHDLEVQVDSTWCWWWQAISIKHGAGSFVQVPGFRTTFIIRDENTDDFFYPLQWNFLLFSWTSKCALNFLFPVASDPPISSISIKLTNLIS